MDRFGLALHQNPASRHPSTSTIASTALTDAGLGPIHHRGVARIADRYMPIMTGRFPPGYLFLT